MILAGCGLPRAVEPDVRSQETVVVQGLLSTETTVQVIWIERSIAVDSPSSAGVHPLLVLPSLVQVTDTTGGSFTFVQDSANLARFAASFVPVNGRRYDLRIVVDTQTLTATVLVPPPVTLLQPSVDTVALAFGDTLDVVWTGASGRFGWTITPTDSAAWGQSAATFLSLTQDSSRSIGWYEFQGTQLFWVLAFDPQSWSFYHRREKPDRVPVAGNIHGGAGIFGAITADRVVVQAP